MEEDDLANILILIARRRALRNNEVEEGGSSSEDEDDRGGNDGANRLQVNFDSYRQLRDPTFRKCFRMERPTFERLVLAVGRKMVATGKMLRQGMPLDAALMMVLWIFATPDSFRSVAFKFGLEGGSVHNQYKTLIGVIAGLRRQYIQWPSNVEKAVIAAELEESYGYPGVIGCIDGCHVRITAPLEQPQRYINRHHDYSILLQAVCDNRLLFRDISVGQPGAVGDRRTFERSPLSEQMLKLPDLMGEYHVLGDGAYPCLRQLLVPFRDYGNLTERQRLHNYTLSKCRSCIERAFALLKGKWRRLKYFPNYCLEYAVDHITACAVLHNFVILEGEEYEEREEPEIVWELGEYARLLRESQAGGEMKREYIAAML